MRSAIPDILVTDVKQAVEEQDMRGSDLAEAMASAVDRLVNAREGTSALDRAIEAVVGTIGRFSGKDATKYLASYGAEMLMRGIPEERHLAGFPRVAMPTPREIRVGRRAPTFETGLHGLGGVPGQGKKRVGTPSGV